FMYLPEKEGTALMRRISEQFPSGQIAFDAYSGSMTRLVSRLATVRGAKVELVWGIDDPHDLEKQVPKLRLAESVSFLTKNRISKAMYRLLGRWGFYRNLVRHVRYEFAGLTAMP